MTGDPRLTGATWVKAQASSTNGNCVEVASLLGGAVGVRDSKRPEQTPHILSRATFAGLLDAVKRGDVDLPAS